MFKAYATKNDHGRTLFKFLINSLDNVPISKIESLFRKKDIKVNGNRKVTKQQLIFENDEIIVYGVQNVQKNIANHLNNTQINFKKIYEDNNILIIDKKQGIAMHSEPNCLNDQVLQYLNFKKNDSFIPVIRLCHAVISSFFFKLKLELRKCPSHSFLGMQTHFCKVVTH